MLDSRPSAPLTGWHPPPTALGARLGRPAEQVAPEALAALPLPGAPGSRLQDLRDLSRQLPPEMVLQVRRFLPASGSLLLTAGDPRFVAEEQAGRLCLLAETAHELHQFHEIVEACASLPPALAREVLRAVIARLPSGTFLNFSRNPTPLHQWLDGELLPAIETHAPAPPEQVPMLCALVAQLPMSRPTHLPRLYPRCLALLPESRRMFTVLTASRPGFGLMSFATAPEELLPFLRALLRHHGATATHGVPLAHAQMENLLVLLSVRRDALAQVRMPDLIGQVIDVLLHALPEVIEKRLALLTAVFVLHWIPCVKPADRAAQVCRVLSGTRQYASQRPREMLLATVSSTAMDAIWRCLPPGDRMRVFVACLHYVDRPDDLALRRMAGYMGALSPAEVEAAVVPWTAQFQRAAGPAPGAERFLRELLRSEPPGMPERLRVEVRRLLRPASPPLAPLPPLLPPP